MGSWTRDSGVGRVEMHLYTSNINQASCVQRVGRCERFKPYC